MPSVRFCRYMSGMKIAFIDSNDGIYAYASGLPWAVGGAEWSQWFLSRVLVDAGWSVIVGVRDRLNAGERTFVDGVELSGLVNAKFSSHGMNFSGPTARTGCIGEARAICGGPLSRLRSLPASVRSLLQPATLIFSPATHLSTVLDGGRCMLGGSRERMEFSYNMRHSFPRFHPGGE